VPTEQQIQAGWREVSGTILKSEVSFDWEDYRPIVEYEYQVDGKSYRGDKIVIGPLVHFNWKGPASRLVARYPVGSKVTVYVDASNPRRATLQISTDRNLPLLLVSLGAMALIIIAVSIRGCGAH
jgi:hypothetical protein